MNLDEYTRLRERPIPPQTLSAATVGGADRTLAYGYTVDRHSWHCYLDTGEIHVVVYDHRNVLLDHTSSDALPLEYLTPGKRVYPHFCDLRFAELMQERRCPLPFTTFDEEAYAARGDRQFHGKLTHQLT